MLTWPSALMIYESLKRNFALIYQRAQSHPDMDPQCAAIGGRVHKPGRQPGDTRPIYEHPHGRYVTVHPGHILR